MNGKKIRSAKNWMYFWKVSKKIFYTVLDWGLGHASRSVEIIQLLLAENYEVVLGGSGNSLALLQSYFPTLETVIYEGFSPKYTTKKPIWNFTTQLPTFLESIKKEQIALEKLNQLYHFDLVISDNRYGAYLSNVKSILITHQISPSIPFKRFGIGAFIQYQFNKWHKRFDQIWIPDTEDNSIAFPLSKAKDLKKTKYIGPISALTKNESLNKIYDLLIIGSGPEPQKTDFLNECILQCEQLNLKTIIVGGYTSLKSSNPEISIIPICFGNELSKIIAESKIVLSRSGYSTIMDLQRLGGKACFVPTPAQTEQEIIARNLSKMKIAPFQMQAQMNLGALLKKAEIYKGFLGTTNNTLQSNIKSL